jgi:PAS domain S-box-containing protein
LAALPAFLLTFYNGWQSRVRERAVVAGDTVALARLAAGDQERVIDDTRQILSDLAVLPETRSGDVSRYPSYFKLLMRRYRDYASFLALDPAGNVLASVPAADRPTNFSDRLWFERALATGDFVVGNYQEAGKITGKQVVVAALPVIDEHGRVLFVLAAGLDVAYLNEQIAATANLKGGAIVALVDRRGIVVARYPTTVGVLGRGLPEAALAATMQQRDEGTVELTGEDGVPRLYAFTPVGGRIQTGLRLAVGVPLDVAYGELDRLERRHLLALLMVTLLTLGAAWVASERLVLRRVSSLLDATRKLAAGDRAARTRLPYDHGELSDLARAFDEMATALEARQVERDKAERALRESEERFRAFMDNSPALAFVRTSAGDMVYANATLERFFGLGAGEWRGQPCSRFWSDDLAETLRRGDAHVLRGGVPEETVDTVVMADGRERYWLSVTFPLADTGGQLQAATLAFDLTEWRQIQSQLARAERRYTQLVDQASDGIAIADVNLSLTEVNAAVCQMTGYAREELLGRAVADLLVPDDRPKLPAAHQALRDGQPVVGEWRVRRKDGTVLHVEVSARPFEDAGAQAILRDVSARHEAERALRESEERFRLLYQYLPLAYHSVSEHGTVLMVNDAWLALTGLTRGQSVGRRFADLLTRESAAVYEARFSRVIGRADVHDLEVTLVRGDHSLVTVTLDGRRGQDAKGEIQVHCALHDVTEARRADARLRESEARYRTLFDESPVSIWEEDFSGIRRHLDRLQALGVTDLEEHFTANPEELSDCVESVRVVDVNRATLALYGAETRSQLLAGLDRVIGDEGRDAFRQSILALARGERSWVGESINYTLNGDPIRLALQWSLAPGFERTWSRVLVSAMDITDRLRAEGALRESEARFERIFRSAPGVMGIARRSDGRFLDVNDVFLRELGYAREAVIGRTVDELGLPADRGEAEALAAAGRQGLVHNLEVRLRRRSGGLFEGVVSVVPLTVSGEDCLLIHAVDTTARRRAELTSRETQRVLATLLSNLPGMAYQACDDPERTLLFVSEGCAELTGYAAHDLVGNRRLSYASLIHEEDADAVRAGVREATAQGRPYRLTYRIRHAGGQIRWVWEQGRVVQSSPGEPVSLEGFISDITDRRHAEEELARRTEQLRQAQKMEAVGRLAGGIAHDFNNLLTAILGYSDLVLSRLGSDDPLAGRVLEIRRAGERAANLTRKLLAFSRRQVLTPVVLNLDGLLEDIAPILGRLVGEDIALRVRTGSGCHVEADPTQIEQVIMNLVINARDAMPRGGTLTLETGRADLGPGEASMHGVAAGPYAVFSIADTGVGMDEATRARLFEPFFTTKAPGQGTGLGLSTVYGIVQQSGGFIAVFSREGAGTTFVVHLPLVEGEGEEPRRFEGFQDDVMGNETILIVEDEEAVRRLLRAILERLGYSVVEAVDGEDALAVWTEQASRIDLVVTDILMPRLDGPSFVARAGAVHPVRRVIYLSGYANDAAMHQQEIDPDVPLLQKPFTSATLAHTVREMLDRPID